MVAGKMYSKFYNNRIFKNIHFMIWKNIDMYIISEKNYLS